MYNSDLQVLSDLGFPLTAKRIQEALVHALNSDNIIEWTLDNGYKLNKNQPMSYLTDEANAESAYTVARQEAPYCDYKGNKQWNGASAKEAITKAYKALETSVKKDKEYASYKIVKPQWV